MYGRLLHYEWYKMIHFTVIKKVHTYRAGAEWEKVTCPLNKVWWLFLMQNFLYNTEIHFLSAAWIPIFLRRVFWIATLLCQMRYWEKRYIQVTLTCLSQFIWWMFIFAIIHCVYCKVTRKCKHVRKMSYIQYLMHICSKKKRVCVLFWPWNKGNNCFCELHLKITSPHKQFW